METKVFISNLEKFEGEKLPGRWLNLPLPDKVLQKEINEALQNHEAYFIMDCVSPIHIEKFVCLHELNKFLKRLERFNEYNQKKVCFLLNVIGCSPKEAMKEYKAVAYYPGMTLKEMALRMINESDIVNQPNHPKKYIDFDKIVNELIFDGFYETESGLFWYF